MGYRHRRILSGVRRKDKHIKIPDSEYLLDRTFSEYMDQFSMDAMALFEYEGLPETVRIEHIELPLFEQGHCVFTLHKDTGLPIVMPCELKGVNIHGDPTDFLIIGADSTTNSYMQTGKIGVDGVVIKNNIYLKPTFDLLVMYCKRLSDTELTMDMNLFALKTPFIIETDSNNETSAKLAMDQYKQFQPAIYVNKRKSINSQGLSAETFKVHNTGVQSNLMELMNYSHDLQNDMYTRFGINNAMQDKKERMVVDEVNAQKEQIELSQSISYEYRKKAIDEINKLYGDKGVNITIKRKGEDNDRSTTSDNGEVHDKS